MKEVHVKKNNKIADEVSYEKAPCGESYALTNSSWDWNTNPTPGQTNTIESSHEEKELKKTENDDKSPVLSKKEKELAAIASLPINKKDVKFLNIVLTALFIALLSGALILIIKKKNDPLVKFSFKTLLPG